MNQSDIINGLFEMFAGIFISLNIIRLYKDKEVKGVSLIAIIFFFLWGVWNTIFYPINNLWYSFYGGLLVASMNLIWVSQLIYYSYIYKSQNIDEKF
jgi:hypothetical protein